MEGKETSNCEGSEEFKEGTFLRDVGGLGDGETGPGRQGEGVVTGSWREVCGWRGELMERCCSQPQPAEREQVEMPGSRSPEPSPPTCLPRWLTPLVNQWTRGSLAAVHTVRCEQSSSHQCAEQGGEGAGADASMQVESHQPRGVFQTFVSC